MENAQETPVPDISLSAIESSQLAEIGYHPDSQTLAIRFKGRGDKPGSLYHYDGVTPEDWEAFNGAESKGSHFYKHIKPFADKFPYRKVG